MTTQPTLADHLATHLATQRPHHESRCDAFAPCEDCAEARVLVQRARRAQIPQQRKASA